MAVDVVRFYPSSGVPSGATPATSSALWKRVVGTTPTYDVLDYTDDATNDRSYEWHDSVPGNWASGGTMRIWWLTPSATTNAVRWKLEAISRANDEALEAAFNTPDAGNFPNASANANRVNIDTLALSNSIAGWAVNEALFLKLTRERTNAGDTLDGVLVQLLKWEIEYTIP